MKRLCSDREVDHTVLQKCVFLSPKRIGRKGEVEVKDSKC